MSHTPVVDKDPRFTIDVDTRVIINGTSEKLKVMQYDHNSERITFEMPRFIEGHDMMECNVNQVQYINQSKDKKQQNEGLYDIEDKTLNGDTIVFSWLVSDEGTKIVGTLNFLLAFSCVQEDGTIDYLWNTDICKEITVSEGMNNGKNIVESQPDVLNQWKNQILSEVRAETSKGTQAALPFEAEYGITEYEQLREAYEAGKALSASVEVVEGEEDIPGIYSNGKLIASWDYMMYEIGCINFEGEGLGWAINQYFSVEGMIDKVILPYGLTYLREELFSDSLNWSFSALKIIIIPSTVTEIRENVFGEDCCEGLTSIAIPSSVTSIHKDAFAWTPEVIYYDGEVEWIDENSSTDVQSYASAPETIKPKVKEEYRCVANLSAVKKDSLEFLLIKGEKVTKLTCNSNGWESKVVGTLVAVTEVTCTCCGKTTINTDGYTDKYGNQICEACLDSATCGMCGTSLRAQVAAGVNINDTSSCGWCCESCMDDFGD